MKDARDSEIGLQGCNPRDASYSIIEIGSRKSGMQRERWVPYERPVNTDE